MKPHKIILLAAALIPALLGHAKEKKKPALPEIFDQAHTVYVQAVGGREFDPYLDPQDRLAIADVRDALRAWNRYTFTSERDEADLIIVVHKGRVQTNDDGVNNGRVFDRGQFPQTDSMGGQVPGTQRPVGPMIQTGDTPGTPEDQFEVYQLNANGKLGKPLWARSLRDGLAGPRLQLFEQFKEDVERAYPRPPATQSSQPAGPDTKR